MRAATRYRLSRSTGQEVVANKYAWPQTPKKKRRKEGYTSRTQKRRRGQTFSVRPRWPAARLSLYERQGVLSSGGHRGGGGRQISKRALGRPAAVNNCVGVKRTNRGAGEKGKVLITGGRAPPRCDARLPGTRRVPLSRIFREARRATAFPGKQAPSLVLFSNWFASQTGQMSRQVSPSTS